MSYTEQASEFESLLRENLSLYISQHEIDQQDLFQATREISIARFALSQQALAYHKAVEILIQTLDACNALLQTNLAADPNMLANLRTQVMIGLDQIERKSKSLIDSAHRVTELLGKAVSIDVDKAALKSMLLNLPSLVRSTISQISQDDDLAERISTSLNSRISDMMIAIRFDDSLTQSTKASTAPTSGISYDQWISMQDSVPQQPDSQP